MKPISKKELAETVEALGAFAAQGHAFTYTPGGSKSTRTGDRPAWFTGGAAR
jgi:hypothetical protein